MKPKTQKIIDSLRSARLSKGISQSELSKLSGIPQGQISRIEAGGIDIRLSSLIILAHALDFEIELVPRQAIAAVKSITRQTIRNNQPVQPPAIDKELQRFQKAIQAIQTSTLSGIPNLDVLHKTHSTLRSLRLDMQFLDPLREIRMTLEKIQKMQEGWNRIDKITKVAQNITQFHDRIIDALPPLDEPDKPRPAYTLDEDDNA